MPTFGSTFGASSLISFGLRMSAGSPPPSYNFTSIPTQLNEGDPEGTFNVTTTGVPSGTTLYWTINHITSSPADFVATSGSFNITAGSGSFPIRITNDVDTEGTETFTVSIRTTSTSGPVRATSASVNIGDRTYSFSSPSTSINEGVTTTYNVTTGGEGVPSGNTLYWTINHISTVNADFSAVSGSFTITNNSGSFSVSTVADVTTEGAETFSLYLRLGSTSGFIVASSPTITLNDTSKPPAPSSIETLAVGGGGNGAGGRGAGGAGGFGTSGGVGISEGPTSYVVTVGGSGSPGSNTGMFNQQNGGVIFGWFIGGGGGGNEREAGQNGGSGGGGGSRPFNGVGSGQRPPGGSGTPGQGNGGGNGGVTPTPGFNEPQRGGGGGGGGGASGGGAAGGDSQLEPAPAGDTTWGGDGGGGASSAITTSTEWFAGGGGGGADYGNPQNGTGGRGGGGAGPNSGQVYRDSDGSRVPGSPSGRANSGGGGGGGNGGGSGVLILRYSNSLRDATTTGSPEFNNAGGYKIYKFTGSGSIYW